VIYVWSDTHFNHRGIIDYCARPYPDAEAMNQALIERWNSVVRPTDTIWLLGDFGFGPVSVVFEALQGHKRLVIGNHDEKNPKVFKLKWEAVEDIVTLKEEGVRAVACHYPMETWKNAHRGYLMLHGHSHGSLRRKMPHRYDVGVDVEPVPVSLQALAARAAREPFEATDHHAQEM
jgi:calcineurin-like phosphoesterase family protein